MKTHYSISELLEMNLEKFPKTNRAILYKVEREKWSFIEASCQGGKNGKRREYAPPPEVLKLIQAKKLNEVLGGLSDLPAPLSSYEEKGGEEAGLPSPDVRGGQLTIGVADGSTEQQRLCESARRGVLSAVELVMAESGVSKEAAMTTVLTQAKMPGFEHIAKLFSLAADGRGGGGKLPSVRTIKRWFAARESNSLAPKSRTEDMNVPSWLPVFLECYRLPMKPSVSEAYRLFVNRLEALPSPQPSPTGRGGEGGAPSKLRQGVAALGEWAGNDWAKLEIAAGFALLAALNLPNRPAAQDMPVVAEIWYRKLMEKKEIVSPEYDPIRIQTGFKVLQAAETWPHPAELLRNLPPRLIPRAMLAKPAPDKEKGRQKMAEVKDVLNKKGK